MKNFYHIKTSMAIIFLFFLLSPQLIIAQMQSISIDGQTRNYDIYLPQNFEPDMPLVFCLHGYGETLSFIEEYTSLHEYADTAGFIVVYPVGIKKSWNLGLTYCPIRSPFPDADDVGFISTLIDSLHNRYHIDLKRVYCCGFSTGAEMCYRLACQLGERFAAIAIVGGGLYDAIETYHPIKTIPVLHIHGTEDYYFLYYGPGTIPGRITTDEEWSVKKSIDFWVNHNNCNIEGDTIQLPDLVPEDNSTVQKITFEGETTNSRVIHLKLNNGGHCWPGSNYPIGNWEGNRNMDFYATGEIWNFFKQYENSTVNIARSTSLEVSASLARDTFKINSSISNPENHEIRVQTLVTGNQFNFSDTIEMSNNVLEGDGTSNNNSWETGLLSSDLPEDDYTVELITNDVNSGFSHYYHKPQRILNYGPVSVEEYNFTGEDTIPNPGDLLWIELNIENKSSNATIKNVVANLESLDPMILISKSNIVFDDVLPGERSVSRSLKDIIIYPNCPAKNIPVKVNITSFDQLCWVDTIYIQVKTATSNSKLNKSELSRIYPNPTNNKLNIEVLNTQSQNVEIEIISISGESIYKKTFLKTKRIFNQQFDISHYSKGIYLIKLQWGNNFTIKKILVN